MGPYVYPCTLTTDEDGRFLVRFPQFPEALTDGASEAEALAEAVDCLREVLSQRLKQGEDIPDPAKLGRGEYPVRVSPELSVKPALARILREQRLPVTCLARRLEIDHKEARRLLDPYAATKMSRLVQALDVLGYGVETTIHERSRRVRALAPAGGRKRAILVGSAARVRRKPAAG
jgi:antitoxin HicB